MTATRLATLDYLRRRRLNAIGRSGHPRIEDLYLLRENAGSEAFESTGVVPAALLSDPDWRPPQPLYMLLGSVTFVAYSPFCFAHLAF